MSCEGVWKVEMVGPYGWESIATAYMKNGEYFGAGPNHYSVGTYKQDGNNVVMSTTLTQHGTIRTVFGIKSPGKLHLTAKGKIKKDKITAKSKAKGVKKHDVEIRLTLIERFK